MNLPSDFIDRTKRILNDEWPLFCEALGKDVPISIRINSSKSGGINIALGENVPWCDTGYYLKERPSFTFDPLFHAGTYYVQEASSMFVEQAIKQYVEGNITVLDLCAAPGGKSTLIAGLLSEDSMLVSNEVIRSRANILQENIMKWGQANVVVTNNDPSAIGKLDSFFDVILVDAPCSGEGMFRKDEGAIREWSVDNVKLCKERQQRILADVWDALKPDGLLLYSTCTYNMEENEENVQWIRDALGADILPLEIGAEWGISPSVTEGIAGYHFYPHKTRGEGFFFAVLRKTDGHSSPKRRREKEKKNKIDLTKEYKNYINQSDAFKYHMKNNLWYAMPNNLSDDMLYLEANLHVIHLGICVGESKGKDFIPHQSLALSNYINPSAFVIYDIDWKTAIAYLKREPLILSDLERGYILLRYRGVFLGFVKNIGNRANNLYPQEWRIRSNNIPDNEVNVL